MITKIRSVRAAAALLIATLMTTCLLGGTFASYSTATQGKTEARVAAWGFNSPIDLDLSDLFSATYTNVTSSVSDEAVIAPGTSGSTAFSFPFDESRCDAPEVKYRFTVNVTADAAESITGNPNIRFSLDNGAWTTLEGLKSELLLLSGDASGTKVYEAGTLPEEFSEDDDVHTIRWQWLFMSEDITTVAAGNVRDTAMGNNVAGDQPISLYLNIKATQID